MKWTIVAIGCVYLWMLIFKTVGLMHLSWWVVLSPILVVLVITAAVLILLVALFRSLKPDELIQELLNI